MNNIFDSHAHYDSEQFDPDRDALLERIHAGGVAYILSVADTVESSRRAAALAEKYPFVYAGAGVHPEECGRLPEGWLDSVAALAQRERVRAVGEIGLDYYWPEPDHALQPPVFEAQLALARDLGKPVSIHDRDAHGDMMAILRRYRPQGVIHRFSGSAEMAEEAVKLGLYLGYGGAATYKNSKKLFEALAVTPPDRILLETDCPFLSPAPWRGKRCDSSMLTSVAEVLAKAKGMEPQRMADLTCENARRLFSI